MNIHFYSIRIETLGCRLNQVESESFAVLCRKAGFAVFNEAKCMLPPDTSLNRSEVSINTFLPVAATDFLHADSSLANSDACGQKSVEESFLDNTAAGCADLHLPVVRPGQNLFAYRPDYVPAETVILCFVNTCTVTGKAEQKARRCIRSLVKEHPHALILVTGCYAQLEAAAIEQLHMNVIAFPGQKKDLLIDFPRFFAQLVASSAYIDTVLFRFSVREYFEALQYGNERGNTKNPDNNKQSMAFPASSRGKVSAVDNRNNTLLPEGASTPLPVFALSTSDFLFHSRALIKIQDGCNSSCTYCRIRLARGKSVSLSAAEVLTRIRQIENAGLPEVTLTGVNLSQYKSEAGDFAGLLQLLLEKTKLRIRISSLYPERIDKTLAPLLADKRICPHFHLSVQSGSNTILKAMRRAYTRETVYAAVERLRAVKQNPFIGVDIITGFPAETDKDFHQTYSMCCELRFTGIHAFPFSARPGTVAWNMQPKIPQRIAGERVQKLTCLARKHLKRYHSEWEGKTVFAVTEKPQGGQCMVTTENYLSLPLKTPSATAGAADAVLLAGGKYIQVIVRGEYAELADFLEYSTVCSK